jgi:hypothetical protein
VEGVGTTQGRWTLPGGFGVQSGGAALLVGAHSCIVGNHRALRLCQGLGKVASLA